MIRVAAIRTPVANAEQWRKKAEIVAASSCDLRRCECRRSVDVSLLQRNFAVCPRAATLGTATRLPGCRRLRRLRMGVAASMVGAPAECNDKADAGDAFHCVSPFGASRIPASTGETQSPASSSPAELAHRFPELHPGAKGPRMRESIESRSKWIAEDRQRTARRDLPLGWWMRNGRFATSGAY